MFFKLLKYITKTFFTSMVTRWKMQDWKMQDQQLARKMQQ